MWVPGTDHAGIATQMMVERQLTGEGLTREGVGARGVHGAGVGVEGEVRRRDSRSRCGGWGRAWTGAASTSRWTRGLSAAVKEAFVRLWEQGLIYRGAYIVNWDPEIQTAVSDLEVVHEERLGQAVPRALPAGGGGCQHRGRGCGLDRDCDDAAGDDAGGRGGGGESFRRAVPGVGGQDAAAAPECGGRRGGAGDSGNRR